MSKLDQNGAIPIILTLVVLGVISFVAITAIFNFKNKTFSSYYSKPSSYAAGVQHQIYWGSLIAKQAPGTGALSKAPNDPATQTEFETRVNKKMSIVHWGQNWSVNFPRALFNNFRDPTKPTYGQIPLLGWLPTNIKLSDIYNGNYDTYITNFANAAKTYQYPFFLRFAHEMNGDWYSWREQPGNPLGNQSGDYVRAWKYIHDKFDSIGATNVTWVWCPNIVGISTPNPNYTQLSQLYPGNNYVDWVCLDGYNYAGTNNVAWRSFTEIYQLSYNMLYTGSAAIAPLKPLMIGETASSSKKIASDTNPAHTRSSWITQTITQEVPNLPNIKAFVWFNWNDGDCTIEWPIEKQGFSNTGVDCGYPFDQATINAFKSTIAYIPPTQTIPYYAGNNFVNLTPFTKIQPIPDIPAAPTPTPTIASSPTTTPSSVPGDLNGDGHVDVVDYGVFAGDFRDHNLRSDFNHDGVISVIDYGIWVDYFRQANGIH